MSSNAGNSSRIAKNTIFLYLRSIVTLLVSLYTSRVVLATLGVDDFGIFNVVGGVVGMFASISGALSGAISRFLTFELGRGDKHRLNTVFSTSVLIQLILAAILVSLVLVGGGWFVNAKLNIPAERMDAANWVLICSAGSFGVGLISVAYNAMIIAHEHMKTFAYVSILDVVLKLGIVFLLMASSFDKLKTYALLSTCVTIVIQLTVSIYCRMHFKASRLRFVWDKGLIKEMFGFAGWAFFSNSVGMINSQGINILTNMFFGVALNAARGIAMQVQTSLSRFIGNFTMSLNPQIIKSYAADNKDYMFQLICRGSKLAYFLALMFVVPLFLEADTVLRVWLGEVPAHATLFVRLTLLAMLPQVLGGVLFTGAMATGNIRRYALAVNSVSIFVFIITWGFFSLGYPPATAYCVQFVIRILLIIIRVVLLKGMMAFSPILYVKEVFYKIVPVSILAFVLPLLVFLLPISPSFLRVVLMTAVSVPTTVGIVFFWGLTKDERVFALGKLQQVKNKFLKV
ncbi:lipopolysaccharide biosynthesis protein [Pseudodesulfovibrio methanolicus]|uniref:Lipopolysaccharide biosynthesis protein n=1 Tax=Pseudodesulfovibrio methanolicus TaxID=3126690 RepID=A0ABZ2ITC6_9BACT